MKKVFRIPYAPPEESSEDESSDAEIKIRGENSGSSKRKGVTRISQDPFQAQWLSSTWKLDSFNEKLPPSERKAEWRKFRGQFERIADCKNPVDPITKLKGMKIYAGEYLLNIIEMQEATIIGHVDDIYVETIRLVDSYFDSTCNKTQERIKFRQMKQRAEENFADWVLRLETQAKFCVFNEEQRKEEVLQLLIGSSVPELADKLYKASSFFDNDIARIIQHGQHLEIMNTKRANEKVATPMKTESFEESTRPIMWVKDREPSKSRNGNRFKPYHSSRGNSNSDYRPRSYVTSEECNQCGRRHAPNRCPSFRSKCNKCGNLGHWAIKCGVKHRSIKRESDRKDDVFKHVSHVNKVDYNDV